MMIFAKFASVMSCPACESRMYRDGRSFGCETCRAVARPDLGAWRYPLESEFRHRLPGTLGRAFDGRQGRTPTEAA